MASNNDQTGNGYKTVDASGPEASDVKQHMECKDTPVNSVALDVESLTTENMSQINNTLKEAKNSLKTNYLNGENEISSDSDGSDSPNGKNFFNIDDCANSTATASVDSVPVKNAEKNQRNSAEINNLHSSDGNLFSLDTIRSTVLRSLSDNSVVITNNNALPQSESIASNNCSLGQLAIYESDDSSDGNIEVPKQQYREVIELDSEKGSESDSSSSSSSSSILISSDSSDEDVQEVEEQNEGAKGSKRIKGKKELDLEDLPPIEDLEISVPEEQCIPVGKVFQIVDKLVVVQSLKGVPAYDLDTVLFTEGGQPLGKIFDVLGPVSEPYYCVRFNSREHIDEKKITFGQMIYSAPDTKHTNYVFLSQLLQCKGSDASWEDDLEPPPNCLDYSDDEQESLAKRKGQRNRKDKPPPVGLDPDEPARKRHFAYEKRMNRRNLRMTADRSQGRGASGGWGDPRPHVPMFSPSCSNVPPPPSFRGFCNQMFGKPPTFSGIAPPGFHHRPPPPATIAIPDLTGPPPMASFCRIPGPGFASPDFIRTPPPSPNRPEAFRPYPPRLNSQYQFPPSPRPNEPWMNFPPPPTEATASGSRFSSPFWIQRPNNPGSNFSPIVAPRRPERPGPPRQRPFWPTQAPESRPSFYPHVPPPASPDPNLNAFSFNNNF